jgi:hypothetical protein
MIALSNGVKPKDKKSVAAFLKGLHLIRSCRRTVMLTIMSWWLPLLDCEVAPVFNRETEHVVRFRALQRRRKPTVKWAALTGNYPHRQSFNCSQRRAGRPTCTYRQTRPLGAVYGRHRGIFFCHSSIWIIRRARYGPYGAFGSHTLNRMKFQISISNPASYQFSQSHSSTASTIKMMLILLLTASMTLMLQLMKKLMKTTKGTIQNLLAR